MNFARLAITFLAIVSFTFGGTIELSSSAATTNNSGLPTLEILKHPGWAEPVPGSAWISTRTSGDPGGAGFFEFPNGTTITFMHVFDLLADPIGGSLRVRADDTTSVRLNGVLLSQASLLTGSACAAAAIGCLESTTGVLPFSFLEPHLVRGTNSLSFEVAQLDGNAFGLSYGGSIETESTPEPASLLLCVAGLAVGCALRRRRSAH
jgi:hypothetical protein